MDNEIAEIVQRYDDGTIDIRTAKGTAALVFRCQLDDDTPPKLQIFLGNIENLSNNYAATLHCMVRGLAETLIHNWNQVFLAGNTALTAEYTKQSEEELKKLESGDLINLHKVLPQGTA